VWWRKLGEVKNEYILHNFSSLPSFCKTLSKLVNIWQSSDKNNFALFFETRCSIIMQYVTIQLSGANMYSLLLLYILCFVDQFYFCNLGFNLSCTTQLIVSIWFRGYGIGLDLLKTLAALCFTFRFLVANMLNLLDLICPVAASGWGHRPIDSIQLCLELPSPSSTNCTWNLLSTSLSLSFCRSALPSQYH